MRELLRTRHFVVTVDDEARVVRRARTAEPYASLAELEAAYATLVAALDTLDRAKYTQLVDSREGPPRNDRDFELAVRAYHDRLYGGFRASAVLVRSAVGKLQVRRMLDASGVTAPVFASEDEALAYLRDHA